jgi:carbamoyltransferase
VRILGLGGSHHDFGASIVVDGRVEAAIEEERLTRVKIAFGLGPRLQRCLAATYVLDQTGLSFDDIDLVVANDFLNKVYSIRMRDRVRWISHHLAHASSTFYTSPFERAAVLVIDGRGSLVTGDDGEFAETITHYRAGPDALTTVHAQAGRVTLSDNRSEDPFEDSVGWLYEEVSKAIGFIGPGGMGEPGKTMGLAPYGDGHYVEALQDYFTYADGTFRQSTGQQIALRKFIAGELAAAGNDRIRSEMRASFAYAVQKNTETIILGLARWLHRQTGERRLCMAGGVALNSVANFKILEETPFEELYIVPAAGDSGTSFGAALYGYFGLAGHAWVPDTAPFSPYQGREYSAAEIATAVAAVGPSVAATHPVNLFDHVAAEIAAGAATGWFQGRSEVGPRALGNRSILADPRPAEMKDRINAKVKHREWFRPFAPVVRQASQTDYFNTDVSAEYMLLVPSVRAEKRDVIAAVTHVDGSARMQTALPALNPRLDALLVAFERQTGVPVLLNTSFNDNNEPIVETPADALRCFLNTDMDLLVLGDTVVRKAFS